MSPQYRTVSHIPSPFVRFFVTPLPCGVSLNRGENFRMKCICSTAVGGRCLWFANQDGDFWTTATVWQRQPATGLSVFKAKGPLSLTVSVCLYSHTSRDGTSRSCWCWIVYFCTHTWSYALSRIHLNIVKYCTCSCGGTCTHSHTYTHKTMQHSGLDVLADDTV